MSRLPGTELSAESLHYGYAKSINPLLEATGGLMLSQVESITGLSRTTVQNWIKRGWVPPTEGKRYSQRQIYRIILINILKGGMALEEIIAVLEFINGDLTDESDDIVSDIILLEMLLDIIVQAEKLQCYSEAAVKSAVVSALDKYSDSYKSRLNLEKGLNIMANAYFAGELKIRTARLFKEIGERK